MPDPREPQRPTTATIDLRCPLCGRSKRQVPRQNYDPPHATVAEIVCPKHDTGKDPPTYYYDSDGNEIDWGAYMLETSHDH